MQKYFLNGIFNVFPCFWVDLSLVDDNIIKINSFGIKNSQIFNKKSIFWNKFLYNNIIIYI